MHIWPSAATAQETPAFPTAAVATPRANQGRRDPEPQTCSRYSDQALLKCHRRHANTISHRQITFPSSCGVLGYCAAMAVARCPRAAPGLRQAPLGRGGAGAPPARPGPARGSLTMLTSETTSMLAMSIRIPTSTGGPAGEREAVLADRGGPERGAGVAGASPPKSGRRRMS